MIKCNVTVCGSVSNTAQLKTSQEGKPYVTFRVTVPIPRQTGVPKSIEISVIKDGDVMSTMNQFPYNSKIQLSGTLTFIQKETALYWNLRAENILPPEQDKTDGITGTMDFWGTTGKMIEEKISTNNKNYLMYSAYTAQKDGDKFTYLWVRFMDFTGQKYDWLKEKTAIKASGTFDAKYYNDHLDLTCFVKELAQWERKEKETPNELQQE